MAPEGLRAMGEAVGLVLDEERLIPIEIDFDDWLERGSGGIDATDYGSAAGASPPDHRASDFLSGREGFRGINHLMGGKLGLQDVSASVGGDEHH